MGVNGIKFKLLGNKQRSLSKADVLLLKKLGLILLIILLLTAIFWGVWYIKSNSAAGRSSGLKSTLSSAAPQIPPEVQSNKPVQAIAFPVSPPNLTNQPGSDLPKSVADQVQQQALSCYDQGLALYYQRDFAAALTLFNKALALDPNCYQALNGKGATYAFQGRHSEGIALINQAISLNPNFEYSYFNLGLANELAQNWSAAIAAYQAAIKLDARDAWAYYGIASIYGRQGNVAQTVAYLEQAIAIEPDAKATAKTEHDFDPVRNNSEFQTLLQQPAPAQQAQVATPPETPRQIPVLYYHSVLFEKGNPLRMPPEQFDDQMRYLSEHGYNVLTPDQLDLDLYGGGQIPPKPFLITFDDGYADNYTNALPILQKYHFVATVFMISSYIDGSGFLTADQLRTLQSDGWTIGGHTATHLDLSKESSDVIVEELQTSRKELKTVLGQDIDCFAYPYGGTNSTVIDKVKQDGYRTAFTTDRGWAASSQNPLLLTRVYCYANMGMDEFIRRMTNPNY
jgi:peptidoglycan/xylan/chitin deacetylase (PgdA/CDA1 family)